MQTSDGYGPLIVSDLRSVSSDGMDTIYGDENYVTLQFSDTTRRYYLDKYNEFPGPKPIGAINPETSAGHLLASQMPLLANYDTSGTANGLTNGDDLEQPLLFGSSGS